MSHTTDTMDIVSLEHVSFVRDRRVILDDVNFTVNAGDFVAITGPNGGGKTTMLRIILGLVKPTSGNVIVAPGLSIGYLPQKNMIDSHFPITVREVVESGLISDRNIGNEERGRRVDEVLASVDMREHADRPIGVLSGGQLQRTLLGRAVISHPQLLVLDEPLSYIDKQFEKRLYDMIGAIASDATILLVSHEMTAISAMANRHLIIDSRLHECSAEHHFVPSDCD